MLETPETLIDVDGWQARARRVSGAAVNLRNGLQLRLAVEHERCARMQSN